MYHLISWNQEWGGTWKVVDLGENPRGPTKVGECRGTHLEKKEKPNQPSLHNDIQVIFFC